MGSYIRFWRLSLRNAWEPFHGVVSAASWSLALLALAGSVSFLPELWGDWRNWLDRRDHILSDVYLAYPWILPLGVFLAWTIGWGTYRSYRAEEVKTEKQSIPQLKVEYMIKPTGFVVQGLCTWDVTLTFRPNMRMQLGAIDWLWDVEAGSHAEGFASHSAKQIPTDYLEGVESHPVTFTLPVSEGQHRTRFRVRAHGQYWYSDDLIVSQSST